MCPLYPQQITKSLMLCVEYIFMMCQRIGLPPISIIGLGFSALSSMMRVPIPPAKITAFISTSLSAVTSSLTILAPWQREYRMDRVFVPSLLRQRVEARRSANAVEAGWMRDCIRGHDGQSCGPEAEHGGLLEA